MRYNVGQKLFGVLFDIDGETPILPVLPFLYDHKPVTKIHIVELEVKEHHRVRNEWAKETDEPDCDGFILADADKNVWYNQYPRASYGQVTDHGDRQFYYHSDVSGLYSKDKSNDYLNAGNPGSLFLFEDAYNRIDRGIVALSDPQITKDETITTTISLLKELKAKLDEEMKTRGFVIRMNQLYPGSATLIAVLEPIPTETLGLCLSDPFNQYVEPDRAAMFRNADGSFKEGYK